MTTYTKTAAGIAILTLLLGSSVAFAETGPGRDGAPRPQGPGMMPGRPGDRLGSSTDDIRPGMRNGSSTEMMRGEGFRGIPGVVTAVASDHFLMTARGLGRDTASTTLTVNVSSATKYVTGSSTASLANVVVGAKVNVLGKVATSTKTITAERVLIGNGEGMGNRMRGGEEGSTTEKVRQGGGFLLKIKNFFMGKKGGDEGPSGGPAAADASGGFLGNVMNSLFGWIH